MKLAWLLSSGLRSIGCAHWVIRQQAEVRHSGDGFVDELSEFDHREGGTELGSGCVVGQHHSIAHFVGRCNERYERGSILLTSNRAPSEWPDLFRDPLLASAGLDRLMHRAEVVVIRGTSFRAQGRQRLEQEVLSAQTQTA